jgi:hypothetical protein
MTKRVLEPSYIPYFESYDGQPMTSIKIPQQIKKTLKNLHFEIEQEMDQVVPFWYSVLFLEAHFLDNFENLADYNDNWSKLRSSNYFNLN